MSLLFPLLTISLLLPLQAGIMADSFGRKFWPWFLITIPLPLIANFILLCLGEKPEMSSIKNDKKRSLALTTPH